MQQFSSKITNNTQKKMEKSHNPEAEARDYLSNRDESNGNGEDNVVTGGEGVD